MLIVFFQTSNMVFEDLLQRDFSLFPQHKVSEK
jgi:hypothetical protein